LFCGWIASPEGCNDAREREMGAKRRLSGPYRSVILVLCGATTVVGAAAFAASLLFVFPYALDAAVMLLLAGGMLLGIAAGRAPVAEAAEPAPAQRRWWRRLRLPPLSWMVAFVALALLVADVIVQATTRQPNPAWLVVIVAAATCGASAGVAGLAAYYFGGADATQLPEASALRRAARVAAWLFVLVAGEAVAMRFNQRILAWSLHGATVAAVGLASVELLFARRTGGTFPIDLRVLAALGARANLFSSLLDTAQQELGIDLRSTWALTVARRFAQPLLLLLCVLGWLSTSLTIVDTDEVGVIERFGTVVDGGALPPGLHVHWPWPVDRVRRIAAMEVHAIAIGHDGREQTGPEDVLWARQHSPNEYTLLLGDGHDLITVDATIQYRVRDARAFMYGMQNPEDALRAIGYRAVMGATVGRTLGDALSENVSTLAASIQQTIQADADRYGLGVEVVGFTIGGMHPPVEVALDYQAVVSAELAKVTSIVEAQAARNQTVPAAEAEAFAMTSAAEADGSAAIAKAAGDAWSFRALEAQYAAAPDEYRFRRRLEALEQVLTSRHFTIVDARIMRDGGELWLTQ
jgi:regulator of protease activity HflC (stomatin/prohibitin superfamily)